MGIASLQPAKESATAVSADASLLSGAHADLLLELWQASSAASWSISQQDFAAVLFRIGNAQNYAAAPETRPTSEQQTRFLRGLKLPELALALGCARGDEAAWRHFFALYREPITAAAIAIARHESIGRDLADSLYSELYGLTTRDGQRRSPLASYSGRGSLMGWLRTTLAQRHIDHHRRTFRETPLEDHDTLAPVASPWPEREADALTKAVSEAISDLDAEGHFLLASYYLDRKTLAEIGRLLRVHEASVSRRLKRLTENLRKEVLRRLRATGLNRRAVEEALGIDPRDLDLNLRALLQASQVAPFSGKGDV